MKHSFWRLWRQQGAASATSSPALKAIEARSINADISRNQSPKLLQKPTPRQAVVDSLLLAWRAGETWTPRLLHALDSGDASNSNLRSVEIQQAILEYIALERGATSRETADTRVSSKGLTISWSGLSVEGALIVDGLDLSTSAAAVFSGLMRMLHISPEICGYPTFGALRLTCEVRELMVCSGSTAQPSH
jgi:hypothetical protein